MDKLSKMYRTDSDTIEPELRKKLDDEFLPTLKNLDYENPRLLVIFSGGNATGKSALSKKIAAELHGLILENDAIKRVILDAWPDIDRTELNSTTWRYSMDLYRRLPSLTNNGLIIRDGIIDWYYDRILPIFQSLDYKLFIIQYDVGKEKAAELVRRRGDTPTVTVDRLLIQLEDHAIHQQRFRSEYVADIILDENHIFDHDKVVQKLKKTLARL
jgi:hypothetical protein